MTFFKLYSRLLRRPRSSNARITAETLEARQLLSSVPALTGMTLFGPVGGINAIVLSFNTSLNPAIAQDVKAYSFGKVPPQSTDTSIGIGDFLPFAAARPKLQLVNAGKIQFASAVYNDAAHTVTLTPRAPFKAQKFFRILRVKGTGLHAVKDLAGLPLNGGVDAVIKWNKQQGKQIQYVDRAGDQVTIKLRGRGTLYAFLRRAGDPDPVIFLDRALPTSILSGIVHGSGSGIANIAQLEGAEVVQNTLATNPHFLIQTTTP